MNRLNNIGSGGCACGDYKSDNLIASATCRKSGGSPDCSIGIAHLLKYNAINRDGLKEIGEIVDNMFGYGADCIVLVEDEELEVDINQET